MEIRSGANKTQFGSGIAYPISVHISEFFADNSLCVSCTLISVQRHVKQNGSSASD